VAQEFIENDLKQAILWKGYHDHSMTIRRFRNAIVHDVLIARIENANGIKLIPKPEKIKDYRTWSDVFSAASDETKQQRDFAPAPQQMQKDLNHLESILNNLWAKVIYEFDRELYQEKNQKLLEMYKLDIR
jgi:hypothetical protein